MTLHLYKTSSEPEKLDKSLSNDISMTGQLTNESSVINPVILVTTDTNIATYNYAYIPDFGRYYYINNIVSVRNGLWRIELRVDVLMTYKAQIRANTGMIDRLEQTEQPYIADGRYTFDSYNEYYVQKFSKGLSKNLQYILVVAGQN